MENILRFESKCGATFRKTMIVIFWLLTLCGTVISGSVYFKLLKKVSGISVYDDDQKRFFIYLILLVILTHYLFTRCLRYQCVPYWNRIFSKNQLKELLRDEVFEPIDDSEDAHTKLVMESRNWICISGYLFPKALTASLNGYNPRPSIGYGHVRACFINGRTVTESARGYIWLTEDQDRVVARLKQTTAGDCRRKYGHDYTKVFAKIYKEVLGYTDYKNVTNEDLWRIREVWDQQVKSIEGRCQNG
ncbi:MAG: hypothetical protein K6G10_09560 [Butyrivibrio sp.]|nr:hypothetical protein [Butyrivibrio sp.]